MKGELKSRVYMLFTENDNWLGQIVLTSDGMFSSVTDYGNFSFAWRHTGYDDFREFMAKIDVHYFAGKMVQGISYVVHNKQVTKAAEMFAEKVLPALQKMLKEEIEQKTPF